MKKLSILAAMMVVIAGVALASTVDVPFFIDSSTNLSTQVQGIIGIKDVSGTDQTLTVIYTGLGASAPENQTVTFALGANQGIRWSPVQNHGASEGSGSTVPNMSVTAANGSPQTGGGARIIGTGELVGMYQQVNFGRSSDMAHALL